MITKDQKKISSLTSFVEVLKQISCIFVVEKEKQKSKAKYDINYNLKIKKLQQFLHYFNLKNRK